MRRALLFYASSSFPPHRSHSTTVWIPRKVGNGIMDYQCACDLQPLAGPGKRMNHPRWSDAQLYSHFMKKKCLKNHTCDHIPICHEFYKYRPRLYQTSLPSFFDGRKYRQYVISVNTNGINSITRTTRSNSISIILLVSGSGDSKSILRNAKKSLGFQYYADRNG